MPSGHLNKLRVTAADPIQYELPLGDQYIPLNPVLGHVCKLTFSGHIQCIHCQRQIKKSYNQGYCFPCVQRLAACDICIVRPEKCHYAAGTCREPDWAQTHCFTPHIVYLANTSGLKVGITRQSNLPTRWIDQGAIQALPLLQVTQRHHAGLLESLIAKTVNDKTNWRNMLKGLAPPLDLPAQRDTLLTQHENAIQNLCGEDGDDWESETGNPIDFHYPILQTPDKVTALNLDKTPEIEGTLLGIKGQYLLLDIGVLNIRKYAGYDVTFTAS